MKTVITILVVFNILCYYQIRKLEILNSRLQVSAQAEIDNLNYQVAQCRQLVRTMNLTN